MKCHKCVNLIRDYSATETDKTFLYKCLKKNKWSISTKMLVEEDLKYGHYEMKYGLGEMKPYYCKGDYIWLDENGNITSKSRQMVNDDE